MDQVHDIIQVAFFETRDQRQLTITYNRTEKIIVLKEMIENDLSIISVPDHEFLFFLNQMQNNQKASITA